MAAGRDIRYNGEMKGFQVGDFVKIAENDGRGRTGFGIVHCFDDPSWLGIRVLKVKYGDEPLHDLYGQLEVHKGWWVMPRSCKKVPSLDYILGLYG